MDLAALEEAFRRDPGSTEAFSALRRNYQTGQRDDALGPLYERHAGALDEARRSAELCWQASEFFRSDGDETGEVRTLRKALALDAAHRGARERLVELSEARESWAELVTLLEQGLEQLDRGGEKRRLARLHHRLGTLWEEHFDRPDRAIAHYQAAFKSDPEHAEAIEAGRRIYAAIGRWQTVAQLYQVELSTAHDARHRAGLMLELAEICRDKLGDLEGAARALKEASQLRPGDEQVQEALAEIYASPLWPNPGGLEHAAHLFVQIAQRREARTDRDGAIAYLRRALGADPENEAAASRLERAYRDTGRWQDLDSLYRQRLSVVDEAPQAELGLRRGELLERKLGDLEGARECYEALLDDELVGSRAETRLRDIYRAEEDWKALLELNERALARTAAPDARIRLLMEMATVQQELEAPEASAALLHEVLQLDPGHRRALAAYEDYFREKGDYRNLAELLRFSAESAREQGAPPMEICARLEELAQISQDRLGDLPGALEAWQQIEELHHDVRRSRESIERISREMRRVQDIARRLKYQVNQAISPGERRQALKEMAETYHQQGIDPLRTIELLREVLDEDPSDEDALDLLIQVYQREADDEGLAWALRIRLDGLVARAERVAILHRLAQLYVGPLDRSREARWALKELVEVDPQDATVHASLEKLLRQDEDLHGLAEQLERRAASVGELELRLDALRELGRLMDEALSAPTRAIAAWERVLDQQPDDSEALEALSALYERAGQPSRRLDVLKRRLDLEAEGSPAAQTTLLREIGRIAEIDLSRPSEAAEAYARLAELLPADRDALVALARLYATLERHEELVQVIDRQIDLSDDSEERAALAFRQVDVLEEKLGDLDEAARCYEQIIREIAPGDVDGYRRLRRLHLRRGETRRACELAELELFLCAERDTPAERLALALETARLWWDRLQDAQRATVAFERVLEFDAGHPEALAALRRLYHRIGVPERFVALAPQLFGVLEDHQERQVLLFEVAQVWENDLDDPQQAFDWYRRAYDLYPADGRALEELKRMAEAHAFWDELLTVYEQARNHELARGDGASQETVLELTDAMTAICREQINDPAKAFNLLREALVVDPHGGQLLPELEQLAEDSGLYNELYAIYAQLLPRCDAPRQLELLRRRAEVAEQNLALPGRALEDVIQQLDRTPEDSGGRAALMAEIDRLALASGRFSRGLSVHFRGLPHADADELRALLEHVAGLLEGPMERPGRAFDAWLHVLLLHPEDEGPREAAWRLAEKLSAEPPPQRVPTLFDEDDEAEVEVVELEDLVEAPAPSRPPLPAPHIASSHSRGDESTIQLDDDAIELVDESAVELIDESGPRRVRRAEGESAAPRDESAHTAPPPRRSRALLREPPRQGSWWQRLAATLQLAAAELPPSAQAERLLVVARVHSDGAGDLEAAFSTLTDAALKDLESRRALGSLEELAQRHEAWERLFRAYGDLLEQVPLQVPRSPSMIALHQRLGELLLEHREGAEGRRGATEHLEAALALDAANATAAQSLRGIYEEDEAHEALAAMLERQIAALEAMLGAEELASRHQELADLHEERLGHPFEAAQHLAKALDLRPAARPELERLAGLYQRVGLWPQHVDVLQRVLEREEQGGEREEQAAVLLRMAAVLENELELPHRAIEAYRRAADLVPRSSAPLESLQRLYLAHDQTDELIMVLRQRLEADVDDQQRSQIAVQLSRVFEDLRRLDEAADVLKRTRARGGDAVDPDLDERLAQVLVAAGRTEEAVELLRERATLALSADRPLAEVVTQLVRLARLQDEHLGRRADAEATLTEAIDLDERNVEALAERAALLARAGRLLEHADAIDALSAVIPPGEQRSKQLLDCAEALHEGAEIPRAIVFYERALEEDPQQAAALNALLALVDTPRRRLELLQHKLELCEGPRRQAQLLVEIGQLQRALDRPPADAAATYQRALELYPEHVGAIDALSQLMIAQGQFQPARLLLERSIERIADTPEVQRAGQLYYRLAQLFEQEGRDSEGFRYLTEAVKLRSKDLLPRLALGQNRFRAQRWRDALRHLREALEHALAEEHPKEAAEALYCAGICEERLRRKERALPFFEAALGLQPEHLGALEALSSAALDRRQHRRAAALLERLAGLTPERNKRVTRLGVVADLLRSPEVDDKTAAAAAMAGLVEELARPDGPDDDLDATRLELLPRAIPLLRQQGDHGKVAAAAQLLAGLVEDERTRCDQLLIAAEAHTAGGAHGEADACHREALELDPQRSEAALGLARSLAKQGRPKPVIALLTAHLQGLPRISSPDERSRRAELHATLASAHQALGDRERAIEALEAQLDLEEDEDVRRSLARLYGDDPRWAVAALANHRHLAANIANTASLEALAAASASTEPYRAYCLYSCLGLLDELDEAGARFLSEYEPPPQVAADNYGGELAEADRRALLTAPGGEALRDVFALLGEAATLLLPTTPESKGIGAESRVSPVEKTPLALVFSACSRALGAKTTSLHTRDTSTDDDPTVEVVAMARPAILVPRDLGEVLPLGQLRFAIGRALALTQPAALFASGMEPAAFARLLQTILRAFHPRHLRQRGLDEERRRQADELRRAFPYKAGRRLGELFRERPDLRFDSAAWRRAVHLSANRVGLALSGDLQAAVAQVVADEPTLQGIALGDALQSAPALRDLLSFAASDAYYACRARLGLIG